MRNWKNIVHETRGGAQCSCCGTPQSHLSLLQVLLFPFVKACGIIMRGPKMFAVRYIYCTPMDGRI